MNTIVKGGVNCISYIMITFFWVDTIFLEKKTAQGISHLNFTMPVIIV